MCLRQQREGPEHLSEREAAAQRHKDGSFGAVG